MGRSGALRHTHRYYQWTYNGLVYWGCRRDGCTHYLPPNWVGNPPEGRLSICWGCGREFRLALFSLVEQFPRCGTCIEKNVPPDTQLMRTEIM